MNRIRKKIEKRAAQLLIDAKIFNQDDYDELNILFYSQDYFGECEEINPWDYMYSLAQESLVEYVEVDEGWGVKEIWSRAEDLSIIDAIKIFKANYLCQ